MKVCCKCKTEKEAKFFGKNKGKSDGLQSYCKSCGREKDRFHYASNEKRRAKIKKAHQGNVARNREFVIKYLLGHPCTDCLEPDPLLLEFDHVRGKKRDSVSKGVLNGWSLKSLRDEIAKCEVRCVRCHRIRTAKEGGWYESYISLVARVSLA